VADVHLVSLVQVPAQPTAVIAERTSWERFPALWRELLDEVWSFVRSANVPTGRNVMLYRDGVPNVEVGVEVDGPFEPTGRVIASSLPAGRAARTVARGAPSPEGIAAAHAAVVAWCEQHQHARSSCRWEVYGHWPEDQDPAQYEIEVYWLLS
jgi:effector-binding domain-containing protein